MCLPTRIANTGISGSVAVTTSADVRSVVNSRTITAIGTTTDTTSDGRYPVR